MHQNILLEAQHQIWQSCCADRSLSAILAVIKSCRKSVAISTSADMTSANMIIAFISNWQQCISTASQKSQTEQSRWFSLGCDELLDELFGIPDEWQAATSEAAPEDSTYQSPALLASAWQTSYLDFYQILATSKNMGIRSLCDLGCGYGRMLWLGQLLFPELKLSGVECVSARVAVMDSLATRWGVDPGCIIRCDLMELPQLPEANAYFAYLPAGRMLYRCLHHLQAIKQQNPDKPLFL